MKNKIIITATICLLSFASFAQNTNDFFLKADSFFKEYVVNGKVDYSKINADQAQLDEVLSLAEGITVSKNDANVYQAFWINAYNLSVIKGIMDNYPLNSPLDKKGFFDKTTHALGGKNITLNDIENKLLREAFKDARFHFVLVCGAIGCPPLISKAYLPKTLNNQMTKQTKLAINGSFLKVNVKKLRVEASQIMEWYKGDFTMNGKNEIDFINLYRTEKIPADYKLSYFPYNWKTNAL
ncbi:DUF547 domain-containing protein [Algibacter sp. L1A34]|uniref:DUF547 domain-containing protein n=1 Tax=Algibacter sp. L1A34 TaxID=2686365 RepID=UPI00131D3E53|nr:DUF547 domain-containing protein [Algibacter sp. L1A34]